MGFGMIVLPVFLAVLVVGMSMSQEASAERAVDVLVYDGSGIIGTEHIALLESRGYTVVASDGPPMAEQMEMASVVVGRSLNVKDPDTREALVEYVYGGGRLLLLLNTPYARCGIEEPCWYDFTKEAFGFKFDGDVQHGTVLPAEGSERHPIWNSPNILSEFSDWCCDAYVAEIVDEQNVEVIATVSGQSYKHGVYSTVQDVPMIVVNDNPEWGGGMVVGAGLHVAAGWRGPDMRMFDNVIKFMMSDEKPATPVPVTAITDDTSGFTELDGVWDIETVEISGRTYVVAGSFIDDGVQVIDLSHPSAPVPVAAIASGVGGFDKLNGVVDIEIAQLDGRTYVVVVSALDDSVQIVEITNPEDPIPVAAITDGIGGFEMLDGARDIAIAQLDGRIHAVIVSSLDKGMQIADITNPHTPVPVAAITDGIGGFGMLDGARDVAIAQVDGRTYAVVASTVDDGIQIIDIQPTDLDTPVSTDPISEGGFYTNLDAAITVTDYQRTEYGGNSLIQITAQITNHEDIVLTEPNHQNNYKDGEVLIFLGGTMPPPSKGTEYRNSFGYGDKSSQWLSGKGADVSPQDCTSEGYWTDIQSTETGIEKLCFWVPNNFTPDGLFVATYDVLHGQVTTNLNDVIIRAQIIPFTVDSAYCSDHPNICNIHGLQNIDSDTYTEPHPPYIRYSDSAQ